MGKRALRTSGDAHRQIFNLGHEKMVMIAQPLSDGRVAQATSVTETPLQKDLCMQNLVINHCQFIAWHLINAQGHVIEAGTRKNTQ